MARQQRTSIRTKLIVTFTALVVPLLAASGFFFHGTARDSLDRELGKRLISVAQATATRFNPVILAGFRRGDEQGRTYASYRSNLLEIRQRTGVERIFIVDTTGRAILDTHDGVQVGADYTRLNFQQSEFEACIGGEPAASVLFQGEEGRWYKSGFAPVLGGDGRTVAVVAVDAGAAYLEVIDNLADTILLFVLLGAAVAVGLGFLLARTVSGPVGRLVQQAERIGRGRLERPVAQEGMSNRELEYLAGAMERMRDRLARREENQRMMVAGVAHEIRNPLGGVEMFASLARQEVDPDSEAARFIDKVSREVASLKRIISDFLEFARPASPEPEPVDPASAVREAADLLREEFSRKQAVLETDLPPDLPCIYLDPEHLRRVLINLLSNALDALPESAGEVSVSGRAGAGGEMELRVADNGRGMDAETAARAFNPFFTTRDDGMGLGLAIVRKTLEENGGAVELDSAPGEGTTFTLYLPTADRPATGDDSR